MCLQDVEVEDTGRHLLVFAVRQAWDLETSAEVPGCLEVVYVGA